MSPILKCLFSEEMGNRAERNLELKKLRASMKNFENVPYTPKNKPIYNAFGIKIAEERPDGKWEWTAIGRMKGSHFILDDN